MRTMDSTTWTFSILQRLEINPQKVDGNCTVHAVVVEWLVKFILGTKTPACIYIHYYIVIKTTCSFSKFFLFHCPRWWGGLRGRNSPLQSFSEWNWAGENPEGREAAVPSAVFQSEWPSHWRHGCRVHEGCRSWNRLSCWNSGFQQPEDPELRASTGVYDVKAGIMLCSIAVFVDIS